MSQTYSQVLPNVSWLGTPEPESDEELKEITGLEDLVDMDIEDFMEEENKLLEIEDELEDEFYPDDPLFEMESIIDISSDPLPLNHCCTSHTELKDRLQPWAMDHGFTLVIDRSNLNRTFQNCYLMCIRSKKYRLGVSKELEPYMKKLHGTSYRDKCPFRLELVNVATIQHPEWRVVPLSPENAIHNHPPIEHAGFGPSRRILLANEPKAVELIDTLSLLGTNPNRILLKLKEKFPNLPVNVRDIYNRQYYRLARARIGVNSVESALKKLDQAQELFFPFFNSKKQLIGLVYTSHETRALLQRYSTVLFMDCTYKTNRYRLPMLHIVGMTATNHTFTAGVAFIISEKGEWYTKALESFITLCGGREMFQTKVIITDREKALHNAIKITFGSNVQIHLCIYHIIQNLRSNSMTSFKGYTPQWRKALTKFKNDWLNMVVSATTPSKLEEGYGQFRFKYRHPQYKVALDYVAGLREIEDQFVNCYTDQHRHFGQRANSRIEGAHCVLKRWLTKASGDIDYVLEGLKLHFRSQWEAICGHMVTQNSRKSLWNPPVTQEVKRHLSRHAERLIRPQILKAAQGFKLNPKQPPEPSCTGAFTTTYGLPCAHKLYQFMLDDKKVSINMINPHWKLLTEKQLDYLVMDTKSKIPPQLTLDEHLELIPPCSDDEFNGSNSEEEEIYEDEAFNGTSQVFFDPPFIRRGLDDDIHPEDIPTAPSNPPNPSQQHFIAVPPWINPNSQSEVQSTQITPISTQRSRRQDSEGYVAAPVVHKTGRIASQHETVIGIKATGKMCSGCHKKVLDHDIRTCPEERREGR